jgi:hypothetical protein
LSIPRLPPDLRETARQWLEASPTNQARRPRDIFDTFTDLARVARLIERGALEHASRGRFKLSDWCLADILNPPPTGGSAA